MCESTIVRIKNIHIVYSSFPQKCDVWHRRPAPPLCIHILLKLPFLRFSLKRMFHSLNPSVSRADGVKHGKSKFICVKHSKKNLEGKRYGQVDPFSNMLGIPVIFCSAKDTRSLQNRAPKQSGSF